MLIDLPSNRDEAWRWSDLSALPDLARAPTRASERDLRDLPWLDCAEPGPRLLFIDGRLSSAESTLGPVEIAGLSGEAAHPLARLAEGEGWALTLGRDHAPQGLVQIIHVTTGGADHLPACIALDVDAQASVVETFVGEGWANRFTDIHLAKGARLMLSRRLLKDEGFASLLDHAAIGEGASLTLTTLGAGGADSRIEGRYRLEGEAAYAEVGGALLGRNRQRHDVNIAVRHEAVGGMSRQYWRAVADGRSTCSMAARVEVERGAQKTDGEQSLKGLLLERSALVNLKPELEIFADDVKCAHGATVGELDRNALFYLASRGIGRDEARALLTRAFVADVTARIGEEAVREAFETDVMKWFGGSR